MFYFSNIKATCDPQNQMFKSIVTVTFFKILQITKMWLKLK